MRRRVLLLVLALVLAGCAGDGDTAGSGAVGTGEAAGPESLLDFSAATVDGGQIDVGELEGRDVVMFFWAPW